MSDKIRLLIITHCFPSSEGDLVGNFIYEFAERLTSLGVEITVFTPRMNYQYDFDYIKKSVANIKLFDWKGGEKRLAELKFTKFKEIRQLVSIFRDGKRELNKFLKKEKFDFILAPWLIPNGYYISSLSHKFKIPYGVWGLGSDLNVYAKKPFMKQIIKKAFKRSAVSFVNSIGLYEIVRKNYNKNPLILNTTRSIPKTLVKYEKNDKIKLIFVGRLEKVKGPDLLINALKHSGIVDFELNFIGDGSMLLMLKELSNSYGFGEKVIFSGFQGAQFIADQLAGADYLVISSHSEGMPVVFWEAMQTGTPVISTEVGDIKYYCDSYNVGRTVTAGDEVEFGNLLNFIYHFKGLRDLLSSNTEKIVKHVSIDKSAEKFYNLIKGYAKQK